MLNRRDFLKAAGALGASLLLPFQAYSDDLVIERKVGKSLAKGLENILSASFEDSQIPLGYETHYPEILYVFEDNGKDRHCILNGKSFILDSNGFFIAPYHLMRAAKDPKSHKIIAYDPVTGYVSLALPLAYLVSEDIFLGKLNDVPMTHPLTPISNIEPTNMEKQYYLSYENRKALLGLMQKVSDAYDKKTVHNMDMQDLSPMVAETVALSEIEGLDIKRTMRADFAVIGDFRAGHSGTPVFRTAGDLSGIIISIPNREKMKVFALEEKPQEVSIGFAASGRTIRKLIISYLDRL